MSLWKILLKSTSKESVETPIKEFVETPIEESV